jgi:membrane protein DedA with SNARE-associated domain
LNDILDLIRDHGPFIYGSLFLLSLVRASNLALFAGIAAQQGALDLVSVAVAFFAGSVLGDQIKYWLGHRYGGRFLARVDWLREKLPAISDLLRRHPLPTLLGYRFVNGLRTAMPIIAGVAGIGFARFARIQLSGAVLWLGVLLGLGHAFGATAEAALGSAVGLVGLALMLTFVTIGWLAIKRFTGTTTATGRVG